MYNRRREESTILYYPTIKIEDGVWLRFGGCTITTYGIAKCISRGCV